jgi:hypothetical protein
MVERPVSYYAVKCERAPNSGRKKDGEVGCSCGKLPINHLAREGQRRLGLELDAGKEKL